MLVVGSWSEGRAEAPDVEMVKTQRKATVTLKGPKGSIIRVQIQALRYRIWDLGLGSKTCYNGKIWAFWTKSGLFWDHFGTFLGLFVVILMILPQNNTED